MDGRPLNNAPKCMRFQTKKLWCGRGLSLTLLPSGNSITVCLKNSSLKIGPQLSILNYLLGKIIFLTWCCYFTFAVIEICPRSSPLEVSISCSLKLTFLHILETAHVELLQRAALLGTARLLRRVGLALRDGACPLYIYPTWRSSWVTWIIIIIIIIIIINYKNNDNNNEFFINQVNHTSNLHLNNKTILRNLKTF